MPVTRSTIGRDATGRPGTSREVCRKCAVLLALERLDGQVVGIEWFLGGRDPAGRPGICRSAVQPWECDMLLFDGHGIPRRDDRCHSRNPGRHRDDIGGRVAWNGTEGLAHATARRSEVVRARSVMVALAPHQPNSGRTSWSVATITSQAIGTAAKKPSAALHAVRRRTPPEPVGWGTTRYVSTVPTVSTTTV